MSAPFAYTLKYDSTPPTLTALAAKTVSSYVYLTFQPGADAATVVVTRRADTGPPVTVYRGAPPPRFSTRPPATASATTTRSLPSTRPATTRLPA